MNQELTRLDQTAFAVGALEFVEQCLTGSAEEISRDMNLLSQQGVDAEPHEQFLRKIATSVRTSGVRRTTTEELEEVARILRVDYCADL